MTAPVKAKDATYSLLRFDELSGWEDDDHQEALSVFLETCGDMNGAEWTALCALATTQPSARTFFEIFFRPVMVEDGSPAMFTGYFEPELSGSLQPTARFRYPLYRKPPEADGLWLTRREIEETGALHNRGLEICWVDNPVDVFFLQIQGSGRVRLTNGNVIRVGYGGANGQPYRSVGEELVRRGVYQPHQVSAQVIRNWVQRNPTDGTELLRHNPSFVFFRKLRDLAPDRGPLGAMNRSITTLRTIAVDPLYTPLGAPVWIEKEGKDPMTRLMVAQDTGSAIKGAQRADIFFGSGDDAGRVAGRIRDPGRLVMLLPIQIAFELVPEGAG
ncbi:murein transglycosylase A [Aliiroseovarius sp. YM-037]|uniref:murein transglycosylase A n=1 Tax=Aliiroseovarius sp. YM-037 TaxID=3341728 RepID=UPI003A80B7B1